jgi:rapamycin-insensitive companion of mTOR
LDLCLDNEIERIHAQKLARKFSSDLPSKMPRSLVQPLVAIGNDGVNERDRMVRASLACICELSMFLLFTLLMSYIHLYVRFS